MSPRRIDWSDELAAAERTVPRAGALWRDGCRDHLAGHITCTLGDGTPLCQKWPLNWVEGGPADILRIGLEGNLQDGR